MKELHPPDMIMANKSTLLPIIVVGDKVVVTVHTEISRKGQELLQVLLYYQEIGLLIFLSFSRVTYILTLLSRSERKDI